MPTTHLLRHSLSGNLETHPARLLEPAPRGRGGVGSDAVRFPKVRGSERGIRHPGPARESGPPLPQLQSRALHPPSLSAERGRWPKAWVPGAVFAFRTQTPRPLRALPPTPPPAAAALFLVDSKGRVGGRKERVLSRFGMLVSAE